MEDVHSLKVIARMKSPFSQKFGIPRQSGLVEELTSAIVFEKPYRNMDALRGLEDFSHLWLIWEFSEAVRDDWSPTVRPPRLGGNKRVGVFATRAPFRPNNLGLSAVRLLRIEEHPEDGPVIYVAGADLLNGTPIFDIKPYLPYADCLPGATGGFTDEVPRQKLAISLPQKWEEMIPPHQLPMVLGVLREDPRPSYQQDPTRVYGMTFEQLNVRFTVEGNTLTVVGVEQL